MAGDKTRKPRAFKIDDPALDPTPSGPPASDFDDSPTGRDAAASGDPRAEREAQGLALPKRRDIAEGIQWASLFFTAMISLAMLAIGLWFARFVSDAVASEGVIGWLATSLAALMVVAGLVLVARELAGFFSLGRLETLRADADAVTRGEAQADEADVARRLVKLYVGRPDMSWALRRFRDHQSDIHDRGDLLKLADRDLVAPLDLEARRLILKSAKRVSVVTALSPMVLIDVVFVFFETTRMLRALATLYGGRPGFLGSLRLGRMVITNLIAAGGMALTDDLFGQFLGQDLLRRVSRKLGEGAFNGALTARIGVAAIEIVRPVPNIETPQVRVRDILRELFRFAGERDATPDGAPGRGRTKVAGEA